MSGEFPGYPEDELYHSGFIDGKLEMARLIGAFLSRDMDVGMKELIAAANAVLPEAERIK